MPQAPALIPAPCAPGCACCHPCPMQARVLLRVCPSLGARWAQGLHQHGGTSSSEMPPQQLEMERIRLLCVVQEGSGSQELSSACGEIGKM